MPSINGVDFNNISSLNGAPWSSITNIGGVPVSSGPTCTPTVYGYSDGRRSPITDACTNTPLTYDFDLTNGILYNPGSCGSTLAVAGYYSDGRQIFFWDGASSFTFYDVCPR
jgi:hypothetical protein